MLKNPEDALRSAFMSILYSVMNQCIAGPTHKADHTQDLILSFVLKTEHIVTFPQSEVISDHYLILFKVCFSNGVCTVPHYQIYPASVCKTAVFVQLWTFQVC